jgi:hypothetical protein
MLWSDPDDFLKEPPIEATWEEFSSFHRERFRSLTFSEFDQIEKASLFYLEQNVPPYGALDRDFVPLNFLSSIFFHTHKGNFLLPHNFPSPFDLLRGNFSLYYAVMYFSVIIE